MENLFFFYLFLPSIEQNNQTIIFQVSPPIEITIEDSKSETFRLKEHKVEFQTVKQKGQVFALLDVQLEDFKFQFNGRRCFDGLISRRIDEALQLRF